MMHFLSAGVGGLRFHEQHRHCGAANCKNKDPARHWPVVRLAQAPSAARTPNRAILRAVAGIVKKRSILVGVKRGMMT